VGVMERPVWGLEAPNRSPKKVLRVLGFPDFFWGIAKNHLKIVPGTPEAIFSSAGRNEQLFCLDRQLLSKPLPPGFFVKTSKSVSIRYIRVRL
jgi:hypothetical protein